MLRRYLLQRFCLLAFCLWVGGFTFYSTAVIPVLHEHMDTEHGGRITQQVTNRLNVVGVVALAVGWATLLTDRAQIVARTRLVVLLSLVASTGLLAFLFALHWVMDRHLATLGLGGFYPYHRNYLIASILQWMANVTLIAITPSWLQCRVP